MVVLARPLSPLAPVEILTTTFVLGLRLGFFHILHTLDRFYSANHRRGPEVFPYIKLCNTRLQGFISIGHGGLFYIRNMQLYPTPQNEIYFHPTRVHRHLNLRVMIDIEEPLT
jgi:hypothetical protein